MLYSGDKQMVTRSSARDIKKMSFGVLHLLQIGVIADRLNAFL